MTDPAVQLSLVPTVNSRDGRLARLQHLLARPDVDQFFRNDIINLPGDHPAFRWMCEVESCKAVANGTGLCHSHKVEYSASSLGYAVFLENAKPNNTSIGQEKTNCRICLVRPAHLSTTELCYQHNQRYKYAKKQYPSYEAWEREEIAFLTYGECRVDVCARLASHPIGLCKSHISRFKEAGRPGAPTVPRRYVADYEMRRQAVPVTYADKHVFDEWCRTELTVRSRGTVNLKGLSPLLRAEFQYGLWAHSLRPDAGDWAPSAIQFAVDICRQAGVRSLFANERGFPEKSTIAYPSRDVRLQMICVNIFDSLIPVYYTPEESRSAGFIVFDQLGRRYYGTSTMFDLNGIEVDWLRLLVWDTLVQWVYDSNGPRSRGPFDQMRRAASELSWYLLREFPDIAQFASELTTLHAMAFVSEVRYRETNELPTISTVRLDGAETKLTESNRRACFNSLRRLFREAAEGGKLGEIGISDGFAYSFPSGGKDSKNSRRPFTDNEAKALADPKNIEKLRGDYDKYDTGIADIWLIIVMTGRRSSEVIGLRYDCVSRVNGLPVLWHDQTKVGKLDQSIRIPEVVYGIVSERQEKTRAIFVSLKNREPTSRELSGLALFPSRVKNRSLTKSVSYGSFSMKFRAWVDELDIGSPVAHQARHSMATNLLRAGANLTQIRKYLGHFSNAMAERYVELSVSDLDDLLQAVWVSGPGSERPGTPLGLPTVRDDNAVQSLSIELSRRSSSAEGGFCTFQPVVNGDRCPWDLDCNNCEHFVLSGADLLYWKRKSQQWRTLSEAAPNDEAREYMHSAFEGTSQAIRGLEDALSSANLLDAALTLDYRRPQNFLDKVWNVGFPVQNLVE